MNELLGIFGFVITAIMLMVFACAILLAFHEFQHRCLDWLNDVNKKE